MTENRRKKGHLQNARVYLSGPMDFVASRAEEKESGWRVRVGQFLRSFGVTVFDPWSKPKVRGFHEYGREDVETTRTRGKWTFEPTVEGAKIRSECAGAFWETLHIDLRMVDISDFVIAYCPTNIYSVGTPHEIILARQQKAGALVGVHLRPHDLRRHAATAVSSTSAARFPLKMLKLKKPYCLRPSLMKVNLI